MHIRQLPNGKWKAEVLTPQLLPSGRQKKITKTHELKRVVAKWARDEEAKIHGGTWTDPASRQRTVREFAEVWERTQTVEHETARARRYRMNRIMQRWGHERLCDISYLDVQAWVVDLEDDGVGPHAIGAAVGLFAAILDDAIRTTRALDHNPARDVKLPGKVPHVDRTLSDEEEAAVLHVLPSPWRALVATLVGTGMRFEEAAGLHKARLNLLFRRLDVMEVLLRNGRVKAYPKRKASARTLPLTDDLRDVLAKHLETEPGGECRGGKGHAPCGPGALVFCVAARRRPGKKPRPPVNYENFRARVWVPALEQTRLCLSTVEECDELHQGDHRLREPWPTPHDLRHTYGTRLGDAGVPPHEIRDLMGHASLRATDRYLHSGEDRFDRARMALERPKIEADSSPVPPGHDQRPLRAVRDELG